jgi:hypothetical protein
LPALLQKSLELIVIGERLEPRALAHRKVADLPVRLPEHVLAARDAVHARLERLRRLIERATSVTRILTRARLEAMVEEGGAPTIRPHPRRLLGSTLAALFRRLELWHLVA